MHDAWASYDAVFLGEVTSVSRSSFEESVRRSAACSPAPRISLEECAVPVFDPGESHVVRVKPERVYVGAPSAIQELTIDGCGVDRPMIGDVGLFFVTDNKGTALSIYPTESDSFDDWMRVLSATKVD